MTPHGLLIGRGLTAEQASLLPPAPFTPPLTLLDAHALLLAQGRHAGNSALETRLIQAAAYVENDRGWFPPLQTNAHPVGRRHHLALQALQGVITDPKMRKDVADLTIQQGALEHLVWHYDETLKRGVPGACPTCTALDTFYHSSC